MENKKIYLEKHVSSRCSKLRQALQNVTTKACAKETKNGRYQEQSSDKYDKEKGSEDKSRDIKVTETYDEVLDLRNTLIVKESSNKVRFKQSPKNETKNKEKQFLDKVCEIPNMHYRIMTLCSVKNSNQFSEEFNAKTNIISERIVNKQLELQSKENPFKMKKVLKVSPTIGENVVAQKIIEKEKELQPKSPKKVAQTKSKSEAKISLQNIRSIQNSKSAASKSSELDVKHLNSRPRFQLSTRVDWKTSSSSNRTKLSSKMNFLEKTKSRPQFSPKLETNESRASSKALMQVSAANSLDKCVRPRFLLSTKPTRRCAISHSSIQVTMEKSCNDICTQTEAMTNLRNIPVQTCKKTTHVKKMQTRLFKTYSAKTDPILIEGPAKYTNTISYFPCAEHNTQMYEHLTVSDLVVLDWVNKHLFGVSVNPNNIIVDDKIREVSEIVSKSTFLSEIKYFGL